ncbi:LysM domain superfamily [Fusarium oxysporum f. sp. vasinfectum]|nr:LysM domain superfamily [Fusarium oxysporum f. sp. vasinfectum]
MPLRKLDRTIPFSQRIKATSEPGPQLMEEMSSIVTPRKPPNQILVFARALLCIYRFENRNDFFVQTFGSENLKNSQLVKIQAQILLEFSAIAPAELSCNHTWSTVPVSHLSNMDLCINRIVWGLFVLCSFVFGHSSHHPHLNSLDCDTDEWYTTSDAKETCNSVALKHSVSSAALFNANQYRLSNCNVGTTIDTGTKLCIPPTCPRTYILRPDENCFSIEYNRTNQLQFGDVQLYNPGVGFDCVNLQSFTFVYGTVLCFGPQFGQYNSSTNGTGTTTPQVQDPYTYNKIAPPKGAKVPKGTTERCGGWHVADKADSCARICAAAGIHIDLLLEVNTDLGDAQKCSDNLAVGNAYCARPNYDWKVPFPVRTEVSATYYSPYDTREPTKAA